MDEIIKRLSDLSSRLSSRLSSVGRIRLVVGLVVVLFLTWLVSPVFHGLVMALYWVCPVSKDRLPLSHGASSQSNLFVL